MPEYTARDNQTGKTVTFDWHDATPPTEADMAEVFAAAQQAPEMAVSHDQRSAVDQERARIRSGEKMTRENFGEWMQLGARADQERAHAGREALPVIGGSVGALVGGVPGATLGAATGEAFRQLDRRLTGASVPGTPLEAATDIGKAGLVQGAIEVGGRGVTRAGRLLYRGGTALLPRGLKQQYPDIAATGFREGIPLTRRGADRAGGLVSASRQQADDMLSAAEQAGAPNVQPMRVVRALRPVGARMRTQGALGLPDETPALAQRARTFIARNRGGIPLTRAQALKREAQELANTAYKARDRGAVINSMDALTNEAQARGLREGIEEIVPAVGPVNARTQSLMGVRRGAEHASETGHILSRIGGAVGTGAVLGSAGGLLPAVVGATAGSMLTTPGGVTSLALLLRRAGHTGPQATRLAMLLAQLGAEPEADSNER